MSEPCLDVSVVICAYTRDRWESLVAAVHSVQRQSHPPQQVIVVIDHNPGLLAQAQTQLSGVLVVENTEARGLSGARNSGINAAQAHLVAFLDDDAIAASDWLFQLSRHCQNPQVLGVGGAVEPMWLSRHPRWFPEEFYWVVGCSYRGLPQVVTSVRNVFGGCACFRRELLQTIGGFRGGFGQVGTSMLRCDDTEFCIRARQHWPDHDFVYEPRACIYHQVPPTRASWRYFCSRCYTEGVAKALLAQLVGTRDGLAAERMYMRHTLPQGIRQGLKEALLGGDLTGLTRVAAIIAGLTLTLAGFLFGTVVARRAIRNITCL